MKIRANQQSFTTLIKKEITRLHGHTTQTLNDLCAVFEKRSLSLAILIFALLMVLPISIIPGFSGAMGWLIMLFALQILCRRETVWLPKFVGEKQLSAKKIANALQKALPKMQAIEHLIKPRLLIFSTSWGEKIISLVIIVLALLLMLPIPFSNFFYGVFIGCLALGMLEQDGYVILLGLILAVVYHIILFWTSWHLLMKLF